MGLGSELVKQEVKKLICLLYQCVSFFALVVKIGGSSTVFRVEFVILRPEIARGADFFGKLMEVDFLGRAELIGDTVPDSCVLCPCSGRANPFGMIVEMAFLPDDMEKFIREVGNLSPRPDPFGGDSLCHDGHENVESLGPVVVPG